MARSTFISRISCFAPGTLYISLLNLQTHRGRATRCSAESAARSTRASFVTNRRVNIVSRLRGGALKYRHVICVTSTYADSSNWYQFRPSCNCRRLTPVYRTESSGTIPANDHESRQLRGARVRPREVADQDNAEWFDRTGPPWRVLPSIFVAPEGTTNQTRPVHSISYILIVAAHCRYKLTPRLLPNTTRNALFIKCPWPAALFFFHRQMCASAKRSRVSGGARY